MKLQPSSKRIHEVIRTGEGFIYYALVLAPILLVLAVYSVTFTLKHDVEIGSTLELIKSVLKYSWLTGFLFVLSNIGGTLLYGSPKRANRANMATLVRKGWDDKFKLIVTYVSKGTNYVALDRAVSESRKVLDQYKVNYEIEVITDSPHSVEDKMSSKQNTRFLLVPEIYNTPHNTQFKARALEYALHERNARYFETKNTWLLHLDEESVVTKESVAGILAFIKSKKHTETIGQGEIKYNSYRYGEKPVITAIDSVRTGDDLGRFRLQYKLFHRPIFGMHGSYVLVPYSVEKKIGFDLGGRGSITEDAYFALKAYDEGYKFDWVDGYIREQSPFTLKAVIKQRRRWFCGLVYLSLDSVVAFKTRKYLLLNMVLWGLAWVGPLITIIDAATGGSYFPLSASIAATGILGGVLSVYVLGVSRNLEDMHEFSFAKKLRLFVTTIVLLPLSSFIEGAAIVYALVSPVKTFDVVLKN
jgi:egghead protein (zeste-white 4 protein)